MKLPYFKSAVAFFFLFFLYGTSIGNGQQGISYNINVYASFNQHLLQESSNIEVPKKI
jgi:hypothetical protein